MKELDSFTVERLEELSTKENIPEVAALARIALAAKRAEPVINIKFKDGWPVPESGGVVNSGKKLADGYHDFYTTPQLNSQVPLGSWIKCSDQMPEVGDVVITAYQGCTNVGQMERSGKTYRYFTSIASGRELPATHWMPLPAAPEKPL
ncbi:TPA: DUF551 domain-containing protein [Yersinia enterocolitica]|nr:DUF551 domain-containing protein [Yersinia enterocolitica]